MTRIRVDLRSALRIAASAAALLAAVPAAEAHPLAPALLELEEGAGGRVSVTWKQSRLTSGGAAAAPVIPATCSPVTAPRRSVDALRLVERFEADCGEAGLVGAQVGVTSLDRTGTDALVRVRLADGRTFQRVVRGDAPSFVIPERPARLDVLRDYAGLGVGHILGGADHLLFVLGLLLLVGGGAGLVRTVTAFTAGHSVTLGLASLGLVRLPSAPIEVAIAGSVLWLAVELARGPAASGQRESWLRRSPWRMAAAFGLLHGLGFAGALSEAGLPEGEIPLALLSFNLGIELGQLAFVAAALGLAAVAARAWRIAASPDGGAAIPRWAAGVPVYAMGSLAALWCLERTAALLP